MVTQHSLVVCVPPRGPATTPKTAVGGGDDRHQRWFLVTDQKTSSGSRPRTSLPARLLTTLFTQYGTPYPGSWAGPAALMPAGRPIR